MPGGALGAVAALTCTAIRDGGLQEGSEEIYEITSLLLEVQYAESAAVVQAVLIRPSILVPPRSSQLKSMLSSADHTALHYGMFSLPHVHDKQSRHLEQQALCENRALLSCHALPCLAGVGGPDGGLEPGGRRAA